MQRRRGICRAITVEGLGGIVVALAAEGLGSVVLRFAAIVLRVVAVLGRVGTAGASVLAVPAHFGFCEAGRVLVVGRQHGVSFLGAGVAAAADDVECDEGDEGDAGHGGSYGDSYRCTG